MKGPLVSEADFQASVIDLAKLRGWLIHHTRPAFDRGQFRTPIQGDKGFPDLVLARKGSVIFAELKSERGRLTEAQREWFTEFVGDQEHGWHDLFRVDVWRPSDWDRIVEVLR